MDTFHFDYDAGNKIMAVRFGFELSDDVLTAYFADAPARFRSHDVRAAIVDFTEVGSVTATAGVIRRLAELPPTLVDPTPRFVVAPSDVVFGLARLFHLTAASNRAHLQVVRSMEEAYSALDLQEPHFERVD